MKYIIFLTAILILLNLSSCNDNFLELNPISSLTSENFFHSKEDFDGAIISIYSTFKNIHGNQWASYIEFRSDNIDFLGGSSVSYASSNNSWGVLNTQDLWNNLFQLISRSNVVLKYIENADIDQNLKAQYKGEALFFRGWAYFACARVFGGVQIIPLSASIDDYYTTPRSSIAETYDQAEQDILAAISLLPSKYDDTNYGRVTKYAAKGILARLYLQKTGWPLSDQTGFGKAKPLLKDIIDNSQYGFHSIFREIFSMAQEKGKEMILSVTFSKNNSQVNSGFQYFIGKIPISGNNGLWTIPDQSFYDSFETGDVRRDISISTSFTDISGKQVNQLNINKFYYGYIDGVGLEFDMPVLRFTDVLLMYAEAVCGEDQKVHAEGTAIVNQVRTRAGLSSLSINDYQSFRTALLKERRNEYFMESIRWFDLIRFGKAIDALKVKGKNANENWYLFPIPPAEIDKAPDVLIQNPGYE